MKGMSIEQGFTRTYLYSKDFAIVFLQIKINKINGYLLSLDSFTGEIWEG
jgi:hypothetical protein